MSKINIHRSTFLEKEELNRLISFTAEKTVIQAMLSLSTQFGVVSPGAVPGIPFRMSKSDVVGGIDIAGGYIITSELEGYYVEDVVNFNSIPADGEVYYVIAVCEKQHFEPGYVQVDAQGNVSGTVSFTDIVRGQSSGVPTCVRFIKDDGSEPLNNEVYQIVDIINSNNIVLSSGYPFQAEQQLRVIVLGSVPMGRRFTDEQLEGLYTYNVINYKVEKASEFTGRNDNEFYIGRVRKDISGIVVDVLDERGVTDLCPYWEGFGGGGSTSTYTFTIVPTPTDAVVMMNGRETRSIRGVNGLAINWSVSKPGYFAESGIYTINGANYTLPIELEENPGAEKVTITVVTDTGDLTKGGVNINDSNANLATASLEVNSGEMVDLYAQPFGDNLFIGWYNGNSLVSQANPFSYPVNNTITLTARFDQYWDFEVKETSGGNTWTPLAVPVQNGSTYEAFQVPVDGGSGGGGDEPVEPENDFTTRLDKKEIYLKVGQTYETEAWVITLTGGYNADLSDCESEIILNNDNVSVSKKSNGHVFPVLAQKLGDTEFQVKFTEKSTGKVSTSYKQIIHVVEELPEPGFPPAGNQHTTDLSGGDAKVTYNFEQITKSEDGTTDEVKITLTIPDGYGLQVMYLISRNFKDQEVVDSSIINPYTTANAINGTHLSSCRAVIYANSGKAQAFWDERYEDNNVTITGDNRIGGTITITATAAEGREFDHFSITDLSGALLEEVRENPYTMVLEQAVTINTAIWSKD